VASLETYFNKLSLKRMIKKLSPLKLFIPDFKPLLYLTAPTSYFHQTFNLNHNAIKPKNPPNLYPEKLKNKNLTCLIFDSLNLFNTKL